MAARSRKKSIVVLANLVANAIHHAGDLIEGMARGVFFERRRAPVAPQFAVDPRRDQSVPCGVNRP